MPSDGRRQGESWNEFIARLEAHADTFMLKVPKEQIDSAGNVIVPIRGVYGTDDTGTPHEIVNTSGYLKVQQSDLKTIQTVSGTFTKTVAGGTGTVTITPASGDRLYLLNGLVSIGAAAATPGALDGYLFIAAAHPNAHFLNKATVAVNEDYYFPNPGTATTATNNLTEFCCLEDKEVHHSVVIQLTGMANTEVYTLEAAFLSEAGSAPTSTPTGGTFA